MASIEVNQQTSTFLRPLISEDKLLRSAARRRKSRFEFKTAHHADVESAEQAGWEIQKVNKRSTRLKRAKPHARYLEDRARSLFYSMGYPILNGDNFNIHFEREDGSGGRKQIDVYAEDTKPYSL